MESSPLVFMPVAPATPVIVGSLYRVCTAEMLLAAEPIVTFQWRPAPLPATVLHRMYWPKGDSKTQPVAVYGVPVNEPELMGPYSTTICALSTAALRLWAARFFAVGPKFRPRMRTDSPPRVVCVYTTPLNGPAGESAMSLTSVTVTVSVIVAWSDPSPSPMSVSVTVIVRTYCSWSSKSTVFARTICPVRSLATLNLPSPLPLVIA